MNILCSTGTKIYVNTNGDKPQKTFMVLWIWSSAKRLYIFLAEDVKIVVRNLQTVSNKRHKGQFRHWYVFTLRLLHSTCVSSWQFCLFKGSKNLPSKKIIIIIKVAHNYYSRFNVLQNSVAASEILQNSKDIKMSKN